MTLYKIIEKGKSCHGGEMQWSLPNGKPGDWHEIAGPLKMCENGIHLTDKPANWFRWNCSIYEAEYEGEMIDDKNDSKICVRKARLIKEVPAPTWWRNCHDFVERDIPSVKWLKPDLKPNKEWKLYKAKTWDAARAAAWDAAGAAAWDAAGAAARDAAWDVARDVAWAAAGDAAGDAAWAAARDAAGDAAGDVAWDVAWDVARDVARAAAWDVARDAARAAAWDAARDAALMARMEIVKDLKIDKKHIAHAKARWEVWQKGYALLCDVNRVLYVYEKEK